MAALGAVGIEANVSRRGDDALDGVQIGANGAVVGNPQAALLEESLYARGKVFLKGRGKADRLDAPEAARTHYESLVRSDPTNAPALGGLRRVEVRLGNLTAALQIAELEEGLKLPPRQKAQVLGEIGQLWQMLGDAAEARTMKRDVGGSE